jgi:hypothetical protein
MDVPGIGLVGEQWDLRGHEDEYLGHVDFDGRRVLELGPASGFLTFAMEQRGADVVAVELADDRSWDVVPGNEDRRDGHEARMERLRNGFWLAHERFGSRARVHYGSAYEIPEELGRFDVSVLGAILLHLRDPLGALTAVGAVADTVVIADVRSPDPPDQPLARLVPSREERGYGTWWLLTPALLQQYLRLMDFDDTTVTYHRQLALHPGGEELTPMFTLVARRTRQPTSTSPPSSGAA